MPRDREAERCFLLEELATRVPGLGAPIGFAPAARRLGGQWCHDRSSALLLVPSAILPEESNYVLNAQHPDANSLQLIRERPFTFDPRLL